jgi:glycosyltransferase involved in cell wall biosynthesis
MTVSVSCVVTSFNNSKWLKESVGSILAQTQPVDEIIIADDASTDGSQDLIRTLAAQYPNIRPVLRETNLGVAANRDHAIHIASGHLVTTLDGDDFYYPDKIEKEFAALSRASGDTVAYSDFNLVDAGDVVFRRSNLSVIDKSSRDQLLHYLLFRKGMLPRDMLFPKQLFMKAGGYHHHLKIYEDWDIKLRMARDAACWVYSGTVGLAYRRHGTGLSSVHAIVHGGWQTRVLLGNRDWLEAMFGHDVFRKAMANIAFETAKLCAQAGELVQAEKICHDALRTQPDHPGVLQLLQQITHQRLSGNK